MLLNEFINLPFQEGIADLYGRNPIFEDNWIELSKRYSEEQVFGIVRSIDEHTTDIVNIALARSLKEGRPKSEFIDWFTKQENIREATRAYADTVYRTNLVTAYNSGRTRQARRMPGFIVGFEYLSTRDSSQRRNHGMLHGLRAPTDSPYWNIFHPPLGYNCRCVIKPITRPEAERNNWLNEDGRLRPWHPKMGDSVTVQRLVSAGAGPDYPSFGRGPS